MTAPYVCSACCHRMIRQSVLPSKRQVVFASSFASSHALGSILSDTAHPSQPREGPRYSRPAAKAPGESLQRPAQYRNDESPSRPSDDLATYITTATKRTSGRYSRPQQQQRAPRHAAVRAEDRVQNAPRLSRSYTSELEALLKVGELQRAWNFFSEHYTDKTCPPLRRPSFQDVAKVRSRAVFTDLLNQVIDAWRHHVQGNTRPVEAPSPLEVMTRYEALGLASSAIYGSTIWTMCLALLDATNGKVQNLGQEHQEHLQQLMDIWRLCLDSQRSGRAESPEPTPVTTVPPWSFVQGDMLLQRRSREREKYFDNWFALFVPYASFDRTYFNQMASSALITHDLLMHSSSGVSLPDLPAPRAPYMEFAASMEQLTRYSTLDAKRLRLLSDRLKQADINTDAINRFMESLKNTFQHTRPKKSTQETVSVPKDAAGGFQTIISRLGRAVERQDLDRAEQLWTQAQDMFHLHGGANPNAAINTYEQFLMAFFRLRRPQSALQVWNAMVQSDARPTVRTWTVMMKGCHISRDVHIMESMWRRMRDSGVQPDVQAWSTRIYGLIRVNKVQDGLRALDEMGKEWANAVRRNSGRKNNAPKVPGLATQAAPEEADDVPKPDTAILNSALSALKGRDAQHIPNILAWSRSFDIVPDVITYNSLLNVCLAQGQQDEVMSILHSMAEAGVAPDSSTLTVLLNSMFHSSVLENLTHSEQGRHVMDFVVALESNGVSVDEKGYGILVDRLLKEYGNLPAAQKVLAHMASRKIEPTPHIYTIFMTYYFDQTPPDLYAADALWNEIQTRSNNYGAVLDVIFYDRMIEGYARHGDVGRTMAFLTRMSKEGKRPGWLAMAAVVRCLADQNEWDRLTQVVLDCHKQEGLLSAGLRGMKGEPEFWQLVRGLGVLDHLAIDV